MPVFCTESILASKSPIFSGACAALTGLPAINQGYLRSATSGKQISPRCKYVCDRCSIVSTAKGKESIVICSDKIVILLRCDGQGIIRTRV